MIVGAGTDDEGAVLVAAGTCLGTVEISAAWFDDETAAERDELRAIVHSVKVHVSGGGFPDDDPAPVDPKARALADRVVEALCADDARAFVALVAPVVQVRDGHPRAVDRETLAMEIASAHGLRAFTAISSGPFTVARNDDGTVALFTHANPPAGVKDTSLLTLRRVNGAWWIAGIARTLDSSP